MAKPAPEYELVLMLDPEVSDERRDALASDARHRIEAAGELKQERSWGMRKMAYEINQRTEADYRFFRFGQSGTLLDDLNHNLKIADGVLRFRIFKVEADAPVIDPPPPFSLAATSTRPSRGRRDDDRGGYDDRDDSVPSAPDAAPEAPAEEAPAEAAPAEAPAAEAPAAPEAPAEEAPAPPVEAPAGAEAPAEPAADES